MLLTNLFVFILAFIFASFVPPKVKFLGLDLYAHVIIGIVSYAILNIIKILLG